MRTRYSAQIQAFIAFQADQRQERLKKKGIIRMPHIGALRERPILQKERRKIAVERVAQELTGFSLSPFEFEGPSTHGLRQQFCLNGYGWQRSQAEAQMIVEAALSKIGAKRPTWAEGQIQNIASRETCPNCLKPLDDQQIALGDRFCDDVCARSFISEREVRWSLLDKEVERSARRTVYVAARPRLKCDQCGKMYRSRSNAKPGEKNHCSRQCQNAAVVAKYKTDPIRCTCTVCRDEFDCFSRKPALYCSTTCQSTAARIKKGEWHPKRLTKAAFEQLILGSRDKRGLTPQRFDDLLTAA